MAYVVTENCIKCKHQDCVLVCPVDCFHEGPNMLVIDPDECIDCAVCVPECPAKAIVSDHELEDNFWLDLNKELSETWPVITEIGAVPEDAKKWDSVPDKLKLLER